MSCLILIRSESMGENKGENGEASEKSRSVAVVVFSLKGATMVNDLYPYCGFPFGTSYTPKQFKEKRQILCDKNRNRRYK